MVAFFKTLEDAGRAVGGMTAAGLDLVTLELMDRFTIGAVDDLHGLGLDRNAAAMLLIESDLPEAAAQEELRRAEAACEAAGATLTMRAADSQEADWLREGRRAAYRALERLGVARMEDVGVPRSRVPQMLRRIEQISEKHNVRIGTFGHAGDGNLHPTIVFDRDDPHAKELTAKVRADLYHAAIELGGTITGEHGIGVVRRDYLVLQRGRDAVEAMRSIKLALDPLSILNPGRVV
jgi:glycolate oxidase